MNIAPLPRLAALIMFATQLSAGTAIADVVPQTRELVQKRGYLKCGVGNDDIGFALQQVDGSWAGFDVDFCRAVATAVLGDANAVEFVPLDSLNRLNALAEGDVDVLFRTTTYNLERDVTLGFEFPAITYYDTQRVLAYGDTGAQTLADLDGRSICANSGTTSIMNIRNAIAAADLDIDVVEIASQAGRWRAFFGRECDAVTADGSDLSAMMAARPRYQEHFKMLQDHIANEPLGVVVREGDQQWEHIMRWVVNLLVVAEAQGVNQQSDDATLARLGTTSPHKLGLNDDWAIQVIQQVGNYAEIFSRNLGAGSVLKLDRGPNQLWRDGGVMYPLPTVSP